MIRGTRSPIRIARRSSRPRFRRSTRWSRTRWRDKIAIPADVAKLAADAVGLIGKWDDKVYERDFADPKAHRALYFAGSERLRAMEGACKITSSGHEVSDWRFELECEHGKAIATLSVDKGKIAGMLVHPPANAGPCG